MFPFLFQLSTRKENPNFRTHSVSNIRYKLNAILTIKKLTNTSNKVSSVVQEKLRKASVLRKQKNLAC